MAVTCGDRAMLTADSPQFFDPILIPDNRRNISGYNKTSPELFRPEIADRRKK